MPKYLVHASYSTEGLRGLLKSGGTARAEAVRLAIEGMGGSMLMFDYAFGVDDVIVVCDFPDNVAAAAMSLAVSAAGAASTRVTVLLSPDEIDLATKQNVTYAPPGG